MANLQPLVSVDHAMMLVHSRAFSRHAKLDCSERRQQLDIGTVVG